MILILLVNHLGEVFTKEQIVNEGMEEILYMKKNKEKRDRSKRKNIVKRVNKKHVEKRKMKTTRNMNIVTSVNKDYIEKPKMKITRNMNIVKSVNKDYVEKPKRNITRNMNIVMSVNKDYVEDKNDNVNPNKNLNINLNRNLNRKLNRNMNRNMNTVEENEKDNTESISDNVTNSNDDENVVNDQDNTRSDGGKDNMMNEEHDDNNVTIAHDNSKRTKAHKKKYDPPIRKPIVVEEKRMICKAVEVLIISCMKKHVYKFNNQIRLQSEGGPIGLGLTGEVADCYMTRWDKLFVEKCQKIGIDIYMYSRFKDDIFLAVILAESAINLNTKRTILTQECLRRMRNTKAW